MPRSFARISSLREAHEPSHFFFAPPRRNLAGSAGARMAGGSDDVAGGGDRRAAGNSCGAESVAFEADPRQRQYCGDDSKFGAFRFLASGAMARRARGPAGHYSIYAFR